MDDIFNYCSRYSNHGTYTDVGGIGDVYGTPALLAMGAIGVSWAFRYYLPSNKNVGNALIVSKTIYLKSVLHIRAILQE